MPNLSQQISQTGNCLREPPKVKKGEKRGYIRRENPRRAAQKRQYRALLPGWIAEHPRCEIGPILKQNGFNVHCTGRTVCPHHIRGRRGELLCDTRYFIAACDGECHIPFIHRHHKADAIRLGLLIQ